MKKSRFLELPNKKNLDLSVVANMTPLDSTYSQIQSGEQTQSEFMLLSPKPLEARIQL